MEKGTQMTYPKWLCDSNNEPSYARVVGTVCIIANLVWRLYMGVDGINSWPSAAVATCGCWTGVLLWLVEIFRKLPNMSVKVGDKEYSIKKGDK